MFITVKVIISEDMSLALLLLEKSSAGKKTQGGESYISLKGKQVWECLRPNVSLPGGKPRTPSPASQELGQVHSRFGTILFPMLSLSQQ